LFYEPADGNIYSRCREILSSCKITDMAL